MINLNTVKAMIKDEQMASKEYHDIAMKQNDPAVRARLLAISQQEASHLAFWKWYYKKGV